MALAERTGAKPRSAPTIAGLTDEAIAALPPGWQGLARTLRADLLALLGVERRHVERIDCEPSEAGGLRLAPVLAHGIGRQRPDVVPRLVERLALATAASFETCAVCGATDAAMPHARADGRIVVACAAHAPPCAELARSA